MRMGKCCLLFLRAVSLSEYLWAIWMLHTLKSCHNSQFTIKMSLMTITSWSRPVPDLCLLSTISHPSTLFNCTLHSFHCGSWKILSLAVPAILLALNRRGSCLECGEAYSLPQWWLKLAKTWKPPHKYAAELADSRPTFRPQDGNH